MVYHRKLFSTRNIEGKPYEIDVIRRRRRNGFNELHKEWFSKAISFKLNPAVKVAKEIARKFSGLVGKKVNETAQREVKYSIMRILQKVQGDVVYELQINIGKIIEDFGKQNKDEVAVLRARFGTAVDRNIAREIVRKVSMEATKALQNMSADFYDKFAEKLAEEGMTARGLEKWLEDELVGMKARVEMIARTTLGSAYNLIAVNNYDKVAVVLGENPKMELYKWVNPLDDRTTQICREIVERTKNGVTKDELVEVIREVSNKYLPGFWKADNSLLPHPNCRSTLSWVGYIEKTSNENVSGG